MATYPKPYALNPKCSSKPSSAARHAPYKKKKETTTTKKTTIELSHVMVFRV